MLGRDAGAGVRDGEHDIVAGGKAEPIVRRRRARSRPAIVIVPPSRHRVAGVDDEVDQREFELRAGRQSAPDPRRRTPFELDQAAERVGEQVGDRCRQPAMSISAGCELLAPGEGEQAADQLGALLGGAAGHAEDPALLLARAAARRSIRPRPPSTAASRLLKSCAMPPVSLPIASIFCAWISWLSSILAVGDVEQGAGKFDRAAVAVAQQHRLVEEMLVAAVGALPAIFDRPAPPLRPRSASACEDALRDRRDGAGPPTGPAIGLDRARR